MQITCWGSRGSIPVSGREYLKYGGDTTCLEIRAQSGDIIIVDAGTGIRRLGNKLATEPRKKYHFIITHAHWDHLMGFPFFNPIYDQNAEFIMHRCPFPKKFVENMVTRIMAPPNFPIRYSTLKAKVIYEQGCPTDFKIGSLTIRPIPLSHPNMGSGYKFMEDGKTFVFLTDNELGFIHPGGCSRREYTDFCQGADLLFHDAEYTPQEYEQQIMWGHSAYTDALKLAVEASVHRLGLFHLNQERTDDQMDAIVNDCRQRIASSGSALDCFAVGSDMTFSL